MTTRRGRIIYVGAISGAGFSLTQRHVGVPSRRNGPSLVSPFRHRSNVSHFDFCRCCDTAKQKASGMNLTVLSRVVTAEIWGDDVMRHHCCLSALAAVLALALLSPTAARAADVDSP